MHPSLRNPLVERLVEALRVVGMGGTFERFGEIFMDHYLGVPLGHRGLNVLGVPVSRELDTLDDGGRYVAEYSAEKTYFGPQMSKPNKDINHAIKVQPSATDIFLLSAQRAPDGRIAEFLKAKKNEPATKDKTIHLWDSRRIAEIIIDDLLVSDTAIDALAQIVPSLGQIRDELAASNLVPVPDPRRIARSKLDAELDCQFERGKCLAIWGMAGSGKSDAVAALVARKREGFELSVWFKRDEINSIEALSAARLLRGGEPRNVAGLLKNRSCLLILDDVDPRIQISQLTELCGPRSKIILTSRAEIAEGYKIPMMPQSEARAVLEQDITPPCPQDCYATVSRTVGGHPLSLALLNKAVIEGATWQEVADDCAVIGELEDGDQRLADRILGRLENNLSRELSFFLWLGQPRCDRRFLEHVLGPVGRRKVEHHGLTTVDDARTVRLHDIVFASIETRALAKPELGGVFADALASHIAGLYGKEPLGLVALARTMRIKLEALIRSGDRRPAFLLALLDVTEAGQLDISLLPDPVALAQTLAEAQLDRCPLEVSAILETIEGLWRHEATTIGTDAAKEAYRKRLLALDILQENPTCTDRQRAEIDHHHAKALNILGDRQEARKLFEGVMTGPCPLPATALQLVRIYSRIKAMVPDAARLAGEVLSAPIGTVSASVTLAVIEALPWGQGTWHDSLMQDHADTIERTIRDAAAVGLDQAYQTFASVGRNWVWNAPQRLVRLFNAIPARSPAEIASDRDRFAYGELLRLVGKATGETPYREQAMVAFSLLEKPNDFQRQQYAQLLLDLGRAEDAVGVLEEIEDATPWSNYHFSRAKLELHEPNPALQLVDLALAGLTSATEKYRSAFLAHRFEVRRQLSDTAAVDDLDAAITHCREDKYRAQLERRRAAIAAKPPSV